MQLNGCIIKKVIQIKSSLNIYRIITVSNQNLVITSPFLFKKRTNIKKSKRKAMNRNWCNQKANPALNTKAALQPSCLYSIKILTLNVILMSMKPDNLLFFIGVTIIQNLDLT